MSGTEKMLVDNDLETDARPSVDIFIDKQPYFTSGEQPILTSGEQIHIENALMEANAALKHVGLPLMKPVPFSQDLKTGKLTTGSSKGEVSVSTFKDCQNLHIGNNYVATHHHHGRSATTKPRPQVSQQVVLLTSERRPLSKEEKTCLADNIGSVWRKLGRELGSSDGQLDQIHFDYKDGGLHEICYQMLRRWEQRYGPEANVACLVNALIKIGHPDIAQTVFVGK